ATEPQCTSSLRIWAESPFEHLFRLLCAPFGISNFSYLPIIAFVQLPTPSHLSNTPLRIHPHRAAPPRCLRHKKRRNRSWPSRRPLSRRALPLSKAIML